MTAYTDQNSITPDVAMEHLRLAAANLQNILKIDEQKVPLERIILSLDQTLMYADTKHPTDICDKMVSQALLLDALFQNYLAQTVGAEDKDFKINMALRAQEQMVRTMLVWKDLKTETYMRYKLVKLQTSKEHHGPNRAEQTEQQNCLDRLAEDMTEEDRLRGIDA